MISTQVLKVLKIIIPKLAADFQNQKGHMFSLWNYDESHGHIETREGTRPQHGRWVLGQSQAAWQSIFS